MISGAQEWDTRLPYVLFAYRSALQSSTGESPFFLLYGRDPQLPTETVLYPPVQREPVLLDDYKSSMMRAMSDAWEAARQNVREPQKKQKIQHDRNARNADFHVGDRVFVYMPALKSGPAYKLACPYKGTYRVLEQTLFWWISQGVRQFGLLSTVYAVVLSKWAVRTSVTHAIRRR